MGGTADEPEKNFDDYGSDTGGISGNEISVACAAPFFVRLAFGRARLSNRLPSGREQSGKRLCM